MERSLKTAAAGRLPTKIPLMGLIPGLREGFTGMKVGGRRKLIIPPDLGFGAKGRPGKIPPGCHPRV